MGKRASRRRRTTSRAASAARDELVLDPGFGGLEADAERPVGETTGRMIVTVPDKGAASINRALGLVERAAGLTNVCRAADFEGKALAADQAEDADVVVLDELGIMIVNGSPDDADAVRVAAATADGVIVEPEYLVYPLGMESTASLDEPGLPALPSPGAPLPMSAEFLRGYQRAVNDLVNHLLGAGGMPALGGEAVMEAAGFADTSAATWGLQATRVASSTLSGRGLRVAILDTGIDLQHPDFAGRSITPKSFVPASEPDHSHLDRQGHGTHCTGTACGSRAPGSGSRYGVAHEADIFCGKVLALNPLNGRASGADGWILAGINWALANRCDIISMSLGGPVNTPDFPQSYESAARQALAAGTVILAAAGNDSERPAFVRPVSRPANCPSIIAVAAVDSNFRVARFSNRGVHSGGGGEVNLCAPGVNILSSIPMPRRLGRMDGTSQATPHVAGLCALVGQETGLRGLALYREVRRRAMPMANRDDFGNGFARL